MSDILAPGLHKLHKAYIAFYIVNGLRGIIIPLAVLILLWVREGSSLFDAGKPPMSLILLIAIPSLIVLMVILGLISYARYKWELTESELRIYKGIIFRKKIRLPFTRINTIDSSAKLVERVFGLVSMSFDTAGGSKGKADATIPMLRLDEAEALRAEIFRRRDGAHAASEQTPTPQETTSQIYDPAAPLPTSAYDLAQTIGIAAQDIRGVFAGADSDHVSVEYEYRLSGKEILLASMTNSHMFLGALILFGSVMGFYGLIYDIVDIAGFNLDDTLNNFAENSLSGITNTTATVIMAALIALALFVAGYIAAVISKLIAFGGFTVQKRGDRIEVSRGLLARRSSSIVTHRVQTLSVRQGLLMRLIGYAEVRAETASALSVESNKKNDHLEDSVIHPFIKLKKLDEFIAGVIPEFTQRPEKPRTLTLRALRRSMTRYALWSLLIVVIPAIVTSWFVAVPPFVFIIAAIIWAICVFAGFLKWKGRAISRTADMLVMRSGALQRRFVYIPRHKIQHATKEINPFQRLAHMATFGVYTAATRDKRNAIRDLTSAEADDALEWVEPRQSAHRQA